MATERKWHALRADLFARWKELNTDQHRGLPFPPPQLPVPPGSLLIDLPDVAGIKFNEISLVDALRNRRSRRAYLETPLSLAELAFLCWATEGVREVKSEGLITRRTSPSAGARHPFESYIAVQRVNGLQPGLYRYLPLDHKLCLYREDGRLAEPLNRGCAEFAGQAAVVFIWTAVPYRSEYRYGPMAPKLVALDAGHVCQNLYLACEAIGCGACAVAAYNQEAMDALVGVGGDDEFVIYCAPVGKV